MEVGTFVCSICGDPSQMICVYCTKDACGNHLCHRCHRCSDCCTCELALSEDQASVPALPELNNGHVVMDSTSETAPDPEVTQSDQISDTEQ
jgi:hypothetical protein